MVEESLVLRGVTARYTRGSGSASSPGSGPEPELSHIDLTLRAGELVAILGPNGAGKTTLLRIASGLMDPAEGEVVLLGAPLRSRSRVEIARAVAVVEQTSSVFGSFTVRDVVLMGRAPHQGGWMREGADDRRIVDAALARCELTALASRPAGALSGGEQKRVAVARALAQGPQVLLLDEPGAFLDVRHQLDLYELLAKEVRERRMACLVVMHDLNVASQFADRVVLLKSGRIVAAGKVAEVMTEPTLRGTFDVDLFVGINAATGSRFFLPSRSRPQDQR
jgi:iron complex transport system ATP-binding protein